MNSAQDETRMPSGQGFNRMGSNGDDIECALHTRSQPRLSVKTDNFCLASVHVHVEVSHQGASTMVSLDTPSHPGTSMTSESTHQFGEVEVCVPDACFGTGDMCPDGKVCPSPNSYSGSPAESITQEADLRNWVSEKVPKENSRLGMLLHFRCHHLLPLDWRADLL